MKTIIVQAAESQDALRDSGPVVETHCDTMREAQQRARYYVSDAYARATEMSEPFGYARIMVNGENLFDVFR